MDQAIGNNNVTHANFTLRRHLLRCILFESAIKFLSNPIDFILFANSHPHSRCRMTGVPQPRGLIR
jgi:hypothetical protein